MTGRTFTLVSLALTAGLALHACIPAGDGVEPVATISYFPVGVAVDPSGNYVYVVNSDFDLQYNQGTIQSLDLKRIREIARQPCSKDADCQVSPLGDEQRCDSEPTAKNDQNPSFFCVDKSGEFADLPCRAFPENTPSVRAVSPGRCAPVDLTNPADGRGSVQSDVVKISAFATDLLLVPRPEMGADGVERPSTTQSRLFVPVRGDSSLHFLDAEAGKFDCGQSADGKCSSRYRVTQTETNDPDAPLVTPVEPYGIAASPDGRALVVSHQLNGLASAFVNDWTGDGKGKATPPRLVSIANNLPTAMIGVATVPRPRFLAELSDGPSYQTGFLVTFRNDASVHLLRFFEPDLGLGGAPPLEGEPLLFDVARVPITANTVGSDSRGIAIDASTRSAAEDACGTDLDCLKLAARTPLDVYVANRTPASLLVGRTAQTDDLVGTSELPSFHDNIPLTAGPSRVVMGHIVDKAGNWVERVFVLCFDSATIFVYDPARRIVESEIFTGRGPHSLAFMQSDSKLPYAFVGHFTDSYVAVVSLDQRYPQTFGSTLAILGIPTPPRASK